MAELIPLTQFRPSPTQPRKLFRADKMRELEDSFRAHGFMEAHPIVARRRPDWDGALEIVEGERRWRSATSVGLTQGWCVIEELSDSAVIERQLIENLQRDDLTEIEEAEGLRQALEMRDENDRPVHTKATLAARIGQTVGHIDRRLTLCRLDEEERKAVEANLLPARTAMLIAGIPDRELRKRFAGEVLRPKTEEAPLSFRKAENLRREKYMRDLRGAPFDLADAELVPVQFGFDVSVRDGGAAAHGKLEYAHRIFGGACTDCPFRLGNTVASSEIATAHHNLCLLPSCYEAKRAAGWKAWQERETDPAKKRRALSEAECERLYENGDQLAWNAGYVDLADRPDSTALRPGAETRETWKRLTKGAEFEVAVARDRNGRQHELVKRDLAIAAAVSNGHDLFKAEGGSKKDERPTRAQLGLEPPKELDPDEHERWLAGVATANEQSDADKRKEQERDAALKLDGAALAAVMDTIANVGTIAASESLTQFLRLIVEREIDCATPHADLLKKYHLPVGGSVAEQIGGWSAARLVTFLAEFFVTEGGYQAEVHPDDQQWLRSIFGVDYAAIRKRAESGPASAAASAGKGESTAAPEAKARTCSQCTKPAEPDKSMCGPCLKRVRERAKRLRAEAKAAKEGKSR